jgi:HEAT repeat protein
MGLYKQVDRASLDQLIEFWNGEVPEWADSKESLLEEIAFVLAQKGEDGVTFLKFYGQDTDNEKRKAAIIFLADKRILDAEILSYLKNALDAEDTGLKSKALWGYLRIEQYPMPRIELEKLITHSDQRLSALAMVCLNRSNPAESLDILANALYSVNPRHREFACDEIGDRGIAELEPQLKELLEDTDEYVRQAARYNLEMLHD